MPKLLQKLQFHQKYRAKPLNFSKERLSVKKKKENTILSWIETGIWNGLIATSRRLSSSGYGCSSTKKFIPSAVTISVLFNISHCWKVINGMKSTIFKIGNQLHSSVVCSSILFITFLILYRSAAAKSPYLVTVDGSRMTYLRLENTKRMKQSSYFSYDVYERYSLNLILRYSPMWSMWS